MRDILQLSSHSIPTDYLKKLLYGLTEIFLATGQLIVSVSANNTTLASLYANTFCGKFPNRLSAYDNKEKKMSLQSESSVSQASKENSFGITTSMLLALRQTKPWVRFLSVLGFMSIGFMGIAGVINIFLSTKYTPGQSSFPGLIMGAFNVLFGLLYFFPSWFLWKFASSIGRLLNGGGQKEMEEALSNQKSFWKYAGILSIFCFSLAILGIVAAIVIPQFVKFSGR